MPVAKAEKSRAFAGAKTVHCLQAFAGSVLTQFDASSEVFRRHPGVPPANGVLVVVCAASGTSAGAWSSVVARGEGDCCVRCGRKLILLWLLRWCGHRGPVFGNSGDQVVVLRRVGLGEPPPLSLGDSRVVPLPFLPFGADRIRSESRVWREVVELLTATNAEEWLVAGPRTLSWCATPGIGRST